MDNYHLAEQLRDCSVTPPLGLEWLPRLSREWRNPLNSINGAVYYLRSTRQIGEKEKDDFLAIIARETRKLIDLTEKQLDLLQRGRADAGATKSGGADQGGNDAGAGHRQNDQG